MNRQRPENCARSYGTHAAPPAGAGCAPPRWWRRGRLLRSHRTLVGRSHRLTCHTVSSERLRRYLSQTRSWCRAYAPPASNRGLCAARRCTRSSWGDQSETLIFRRESDHWVPSRRAENRRKRCLLGRADAGIFREAAQPGGSAVNMLRRLLNNKEDLSMDAVWDRIIHDRSARSRVIEDAMRNCADAALWRTARDAVWLEKNFCRETISLGRTRTWCIHLCNIAQSVLAFCTRAGPGQR